MIVMVKKQLWEVLYVLICDSLCWCSLAFQKQTTEIQEKQASVMAELAKVEPAVQDAKMGEF